jgi:hypothetical protein
MCYNWTKAYKTFLEKFTHTFDKLDHFTIVHYFPLSTDMVELIKRVTKFTAKFLYKVEHRLKIFNFGQLSANSSIGSSTAKGIGKE